MKALQNKLLILIVSSTLFPALVVMAIAFSNYGRIVENNSGQIMQLMCSEKRQVIDEKLLNIEQSVHTIYHFATEQYSNTDNLWQDEGTYGDNRQIYRWCSIRLLSFRFCDTRTKAGSMVGTG